MVSVSFLLFFLYSDIERKDTRNFREKKIFRVALSGTLEVEYINHILYVYRFIYYIFIYYLYIVFSLCSFSLQFYGINFLCPASGSFLYLVSKGHSAGCARNDNSVSFHHAMFAHQCRNPEKYGINSFPLIYQKSIGTKTQLFKICFFQIGTKTQLSFEQLYHIGLFFC